MARLLQEGLEEARHSGAIAHDGTDCLNLSRSQRHRCHVMGLVAGAALLMWTTAVGAQTSAVLPPTSRDIVAVRATMAPVTDGDSDDEWKSAAVTGFIQHEPRRGDRLMFERKPWCFTTKVIST